MGDTYILVGSGVAVVASMGGYAFKWAYGVLKGVERKLDAVLQFEARVFRLEKLYDQVSTDMCSNKLCQMKQQVSQSKLDALTITMKESIDGLKEAVHSIWAKLDLLVERGTGK